MLEGAPVSTLGLATATGWMNAKLFPQVLAHFIKHIGCSNEKTARLLMDNHDSHCSLEVVDLARENGLTIVTFPPHCSHRLQPLSMDASKTGRKRKLGSARVLTRERTTARVCLLKRKRKLRNQRVKKTHTKKRLVEENILDSEPEDKGSFHGDDSSDTLSTSTTDIHTHLSITYMSLIMDVLIL